jgi:hypothetical protein
MTNQGVNFQLPSGGQFSVAVDTEYQFCEMAWSLGYRFGEHYVLRSAVSKTCSSCTAGRCGS